MRWALWFVLGVSVCLPASAARFLIHYGQGFDNATPRAPVGGNPGTTVGQQRRVALRYAADLLGAKLASPVPIVVNASFIANLSCGLREANLARTGPHKLAWFDAADSPPGIRPDTLYPIALANALSRVDGDPDGSDIDAKFNAKLDGDSCLAGVRWYYGLDDHPKGNDEDFLATAVHELIHGLGFISFVALQDGPDGQCGTFFKGMPDIFSIFIKDLAQGATWPHLPSAAARCRSAANDGFPSTNDQVVWTGDQTAEAAVHFLTAGTKKGYVKLYAPHKVLPGSSISHWDTSLQPVALMEPFDGVDIEVRQHGIGLAACVLADMGWQLRSGTVCPDRAEGPPLPDTVPPLHDGNDSTADSGGGGGGCTLGSGVFDPLLWLMVVLAAGLAWRRSAHDV